MLTKIYKIIFICLIFFNQSNSYSKSLDSDNFSKKNLYNYISALVSLDNNQNSKSLIFFKILALSADRIADKCNFIAEHWLLLDAP